MPYWVLTGTNATSGGGSKVTYGQNASGQGTLTDTSQSFPGIVGDTVVAGSSAGTVASITKTIITLTSAWNGGTPAPGTGYTVFASSVVTNGGGMSCFYYGAPPGYTSANCPGLQTTPVPGQTELTDPRGLAELHQFDTSFRVTGIEDALGDLWQYTYEDASSCSTPSADNSNLCAITDPFGNNTRFTYDGRGNVASVVDQLGHTWRYTYTGLNDISTVQDPRTGAPCAPNPCKTTYTYGSQNGSTNVLTQIKDASGNITNLAYVDAANPGLVTSVTDALNHATNFAYDGYGDLKTVSDAITPTPDTFSYRYDAGGRLTPVVDARQDTACPNGCQTVYSYDAMNDLLSVQDAFNGANALTVYTYDNVGNRISATNPRAGCSAASACGPTSPYTTTYRYDTANRLGSVTDALGRRTSYTYDVNDNLTTLADPRRQGTGNHVTYTYDGMNRLTAIAYPDAHYRTDFSYNADGLGTR